jgi:predicted S18 family serine protease
MTGAIDQVGHILPIGAVNEKIEGFYDVCVECCEETGAHGVVIPTANVGDLMLREDVVQACAEGRFHVHAVDTIHDALSILTGYEAGERDADGSFPEGTLFAIAVRKAREYWEKATRAGPQDVQASAQAIQGEGEAEEEEPQPEGPEAGGTDWA